MRARNIKPGFYDNELLGSVSPMAHLLFPGLWMFADWTGYMEYRPMKIKAKVFPYRDADIAALCDELEAIGMVRRYDVEGKSYLRVMGFERHQNPVKKERDKPSDIPRERSQYDPSTIPVRSQNDPGSADILIPDVLIPDILKPDVLMGKNQVVKKPSTSGPVSISSLLPEALAGHTPHIVDRILAKTRQNPKTHEHFWQSVANLMHDIDRLDVLYDAVTHCESSEGATIRKPGGYIYTRCRDALPIGKEMPLQPPQGTNGDSAAHDRHPKQRTA